MQYTEKLQRALAATAAADPSLVGRAIYKDKWHVACQKGCNNGGIQPLSNHGGRSLGHCLARVLWKLFNRWRSVSPVLEAFIRCLAIFGAAQLWPDKRPMGAYRKAPIKTKPPPPGEMIHTISGNKHHQNAQVFPYLA